MGIFCYRGGFGKTQKNLFRAKWTWRGGGGELAMGNFRGSTFLVFLRVLVLVVLFTEGQSLSSFISVGLRLDWDTQRQVPWPHLCSLGDVLGFGWAWFPIRFKFLEVPICWGRGGWISVRPAPFASVCTLVTQRSFGQTVKDNRPAAKFWADNRRQSTCKTIDCKVEKEEAARDHAARAVMSNNTCVARRCFPTTVQQSANPIHTNGEDVSSRTGFRANLKLLQH